MFMPAFAYIINEVKDEFFIDVLCNNKCKRNDRNQIMIL